MEIQLISEATPHEDAGMPGGSLVEAQQKLRRMVLDSVTSPHSRRSYTNVLDDLFVFSADRPLTWALLMEYRASMEGLAAAAPTVRKLVAEA